MQIPTIDPRYAWREYAALGVLYFYGVSGVELALVMLAAPAATAGAICVDRARGTLAHMLATDLSDPEIVLGKLAARLLPVLGLALASVLPAFSGLLFARSRPVVIANVSEWVACWDVILILSAAVISGLAIRTVGRRSQTDPPAEADAEDASFQPARGDRQSIGTTPLQPDGV
jgi:ABC-type transport system involved in multi-copper enzyme maturation permease subunit